MNFTATIGTAFVHISCKLFRTNHDNTNKHLMS